MKGHKVTTLKVNYKTLFDYKLSEIHSGSITKQHLLQSGVVRALNADVFP